LPLRTLAPSGVMASARGLADGVLGAKPLLGEQQLSAVRECVRHLKLIECDALSRGKDDPNRRLLRQELDRLRDELDRRARQKRESAR
jgi:hypothetical protein